MQDYIVKPHDSLWKIAKQHNLTVDTLAHANGLKGRQVHDLCVGQKLVLPGDGSSEPDTLLTLRFRGLDFTAFTPKKIQVEHDGKTRDCALNDDGCLSLSIMDHSRGLKVWIETLDKEMVLVSDYPTLSVGKWTASIDSRMIKILGNMLAEKGAPETTTEELKQSIVAKAQAAGGQTVQEQTRVDGGEPVHALATIYTSDNLRLFPGNEKYRPLLIDSARKYGLTPHLLAALVDAEAAKKDGVWDEKSNAKNPKLAQGLAQFFAAGWIDVFKNTESLLCQDWAVSRTKCNRLMNRS
jgi:hypothetical protein